jgi:membrane protein DedA with SNARE-associated domain
MTDWVFRLIEWGGYPAVLLLMLFETMFPPMPSEVILPLAGYQAWRGALTLPGVVAVATTGSMIGNYLWYQIARSIGEERLHRFIDRHGRWLTLDWEEVERVQRLFDRHGAGIVFVARVLPAVRTFVSIPAGIARMNLAKYLLWSSAGTALWSWALAAIGFGLGRRFGLTAELIGPVTAATVALLALYYIWRLFTWDRRHPRPASPGESGRAPD